MGSMRSAKEGSRGTEDCPDCRGQGAGAGGPERASERKPELNCEEQEVLGEEGYKGPHVQGHRGIRQRGLLGNSPIWSTV